MLGISLSLSARRSPGARRRRRRPGSRRPRRAEPPRGCRALLPRQGTASFFVFTVFNYFLLPGHRSPSFSSSVRPIWTKQSKVVLRLRRIWDKQVELIFLATLRPTSRPRFPLPRSGRRRVSGVSADAGQRHPLKKERAQDLLGISGPYFRTRLRFSSGGSQICDLPSFMWLRLESQPVLFWTRPHPFPIIRKLYH